MIEIESKKGKIPFNKNFQISPVMLGYYLSTFFWKVHSQWVFICRYKREWAYRYNNKHRRIKCYQLQSKICKLQNEFDRLEEINYLVITQDEFMKQIADREDINVATVRKIFNSAEKIIFGYLSSTTPSDNTVIKIMDGLSLECNYIPERKMHTFDDFTCKPRIWAKPKMTRYYNRKLNGYFDEQ